MVLGIGNHSNQDILLVCIIRITSQNGIDDSSQLRRKVSRFPNQGVKVPWPVATIAHIFCFKPDWGVHCEDVFRQNKKILRWITSGHIQSQDGDDTIA